MLGRRLVGLVVTDIAIGAEGPGFHPRAGQMGHSVANCSPSLRCFFGPVLSRRCAVEIDPATRYMLWRNIASMMTIGLL